MSLECVTGFDSNSNFGDTILLLRKPNQPYRILYQAITIPSTKFSYIVVYVCSVADWQFVIFYLFCVSRMEVGIVRGICAEGKKIEFSETA